MEAGLKDLQGRAHNHLSGKIIPSNDHPVGEESSPRLGFSPPNG